MRNSYKSQSNQRKLRSQSPILSSSSSLQSFNKYKKQNNSQLDMKHQHDISTPNGNNKNNYSTQVYLKPLSPGRQTSKILHHEKEKEDRRSKLVKKIKDEKILKEMEELKECTFKPKTNNRNFPPQDNQNLYNRQLEWMRNKFKKLEQEKYKEQVKLEVELTFKPRVNSTKKFAYHDLLDYHNVKYFERIKIANQMKEEKHSKANPDFAKKYDKDREKNRLLLVNMHSNNTKSNNSAFIPVIPIIPKDLSNGQLKNKANESLIYKKPRNADKFKCSSKISDSKEIKHNVDQSSAYEDIIEILKPDVLQGDDFWDI